MKFATGKWCAKTPRTDPHRLVAAQECVMFRNSILLLVLLVFVGVGVPGVAAEDPPRKGFRVSTTTYRGSLKAGRDKAKKLGGSGGSTTVGGRLGTGGGSSFHGRGTREVPALVEDDAAQRQADIALGVARDPKSLPPPSSLSHGDRFSWELDGIRGDGVRGQVTLEVTEPGKGDEAELLTDSGVCIRKMGLFKLGKTYEIVSPADSEGDATWVEFTFELVDAADFEF
jgi:hypothetical protein